MKTHLFALGVSCLLAAATAMGGSPAILDKTALTPEEPVPLNVVELDTSFVFSSGIEFTHKEIGRGNALHNNFQYTRRTQISGQWYWQVGANYDRFDFGGSATSLLPSALQTFNVPIGISYIMFGHVGFLAEIRPGFYFEREVTRGAFDIPFNLGGMLPLIDDKLYGVWGLGTSILRDWPVIPTVGVVWLISDKFRLMAYVPEPKLIYQATDALAFWAGGEFVGGSYKVGRRSDPKLSNAVVDYVEYRVGGGFTYEPADHWEINLAGGYAIERTFDFHRADMSYHSDPAPYIRFQVTGEF